MDQFDSIRLFTSKLYRVWATCELPERVGSLERVSVRIHLWGLGMRWIVLTVARRLRVTKQHPRSGHVEHRILNVRCT